MSDDAKWYVIHTYSGYENKVAEDIKKTVEALKKSEDEHSRSLGKMIQEVQIPTETVLEIKDNKEKEVTRKTYPGYVLVKMIVTDETWYIVRNIRGCTGFVGSLTQPFPLTPEEVKRMGVEKRSVQVSFSVGDTVRINEGSFEDMTGVVTEINTDSRIAKISISMFGRETPTEVPLSQLEPII